jgi:hypothetical protein
MLYEDGGRAAATSAEFEPRHFANGVTLLDYAVAGDAAPGNTIRLFLHWQLIESPPGEIYTFNHLVDASGERWGQADGILCPMNQWHSGQQVWLWYDILVDPAAPPPPYRIRTGLYTYPAIENIPVLGADGQAAGDAVILEIP